MSEPSAETSELYARARTRCEAGLRALADKPEETPDTTVRALWHLAAGRALSAETAALLPLPPLGTAEAAELDRLLEARLGGTPLAYLTGRQRFFGLELVAGPEALIPRKETELLAAAALERVRGAVAARGEALVVDVCTGAGNVALALAANEPLARVYGADLSEAAIGLARRNAARLGLDDRTGFRAGDLLSPFDEPAFLGRVDVLTCNPPYISSAKVDALPAEIGRHEPRMAFDGGPFGVRVLERLLRDAPRFLGPSGSLVFEVGLGQGQALMRRLAGGSAFEDVEGRQDAAGQVRVVLARATRGRATP